MSEIAPARRLAYQALQAYEAGALIDAAWSETAAEAGSAAGRDRALALTLTYGVVRRLRTIDYVLAQVVTRPLAKTDPRVRMILRIAVFQMLWLERIPDHAAVDDAVEMAKRFVHPRTAGFVNGVLRAVQRARDRLRFPDPERDPVRHLGVVTSHPDWLVRRYLERLGFDEAKALLEANNRPPALTLRVNRLRTTRSALLEAFAAHGIAAEPGRYAPEAVVAGGQTAPSDLPGFADGWFTPQDEGSMLVSHLLAPSAGQAILDACAAPGTKSTHLAELSGDQGIIHAWDVDGERVALIEQGMRRLRLQSIRPLQVDARRATSVLPPESCDAILVDAPCSGLGTLARRPDLRWRKQARDIAVLAKLQVELLHAVAPLLRPGGSLVYSTCTTEPEENQAVAMTFLQQRRDFRVAAAEGWPGPQDAWLQDEPGLQLWPHRHGTDGFYMVRLQRMPA